MQLWLDACPQRENPLQQKTEVVSAPLQLLASPEGENGSLQLRQQAWVYHIALEKGEQISVQLHGPRAYLQSIHGTVHAVAQEQQKQALTCGDGAFIRDEANITLVNDSIFVYSLKIISAPKGADGIIRSARRQDLFSPGYAAPASGPDSHRNNTSRGNNAPADRSY